MPTETATQTVTPDIVDSAELATIVRINNLQPETAKSLQFSFAPVFAEAKKILDQCRGIAVTDASQKLEMKLARECRLALRNVRVTSDNTRKSLKEESLRTGKAIDGFHNILLHLVSAEEQRLEEQEKFVERQEATRKAQLKAKREDQLSAFGIETSFYNLAEMPDADFNQLLSNTIAAHEAKKEAARKAEQDRIAREKAEADGRERVRLENERLKREAVEREAAAKKEREEADAARRQVEAKAAAEKAEIEAKAKAERDASDAAAAKAKAEADAILAEERRRNEEAAKAERAKVAEEQRVAAEAARIEREKLERQAAADRKAKAEAEAKVRAAEQAEKKRLADEERARKKAAAAPDREKLIAVANAIVAIATAFPSMASEEAAKAAERIKITIGKTADSILEEAEKL